MERKYIPESENRLLLMYLLRQVGPVTAMQLLQALSEADLMNYITMQLALAELEEQKQVSQMAHPLGNLLGLTREGLYTLLSFEKRIPASRREQIDAHVEAWQSRFRLEQMAPADSFTLPDGRACVHLLLLEKSDSLLDVMLYLPAGERLTFLAERWRACIQPAYTTVLAYLSSGYLPGAPGAEIAAGTVRAIGGGNFLVSLTDDAEHPTINLMMSLPDEQLAHYAALHWPEVSASLRSMLLELLRTALPGK